MGLLCAWARSTVEVGAESVFERGLGFTFSLARERQVQNSVQ